MFSSKFDRYIQQMLSDNLKPFVSTTWVGAREGKLSIFFDVNSIPLQISISPTISRRYAVYSCRKMITSTYNFSITVVAELDKLQIVVKYDH